MTVSLIVAISQNGVIGRSGKLPWHLSDDLRRFKRLTMGHHIIMGRKTFQSIGRLLPGRTTVVVTRNPAFHAPGAIVVPDLAAALETAEDDSEVFVVGGAQVYALALPLVQRIYLTRIDTPVDGDTYFPDFDRNQWQLVSQQAGVANQRNDFDYTFEIYERRNRTTAAAIDSAITGQHHFR